MFELTSPQLWRKAVKALPAVFVVFYLSFNAVSGDRGIYAWFKAKDQLQDIEQRLMQVQTQHTEYEAKIRRLRAQSLDLDMLDEQTREVLGFIGKDEIVVPLEEGERD